MNTLIDEVCYKLDDKYSKEKIAYVCNNYFLIMRDAVKLASNIYISNLGSFFLSSSLIKHKITKYERMKLDTTDLKKLLDFSANNTIKKNGSSNPRRIKRNSI